ncbi:MAG: flagellar hook-basal body complex protein FliE [Planctomycetota bacterium]
MTQPIGDPASSARSAIESALRRHADSVARARSAADPAPAEGPRSGGFASLLEGGIEKFDSTVRGNDHLVDDFVTGKVEDFHEIALRLKQSELSFRFTMEVRNKLVDAYREVMRMSV